MLKSKLTHKQLKKICIDSGADLFGIADISEEKKSFNLSPELIKGLSRAVVIGVRLSNQIFADIKDKPTKLYFHHYRTANSFLDQISFKVSNWLQNKGYQTLPIPASQIIDWEKLTAHVSHRRMAYLAGLGWIGRNNLLINEKFGSSIRLAVILSDIAIPSDKPKKNNCGSCKLCISVCPVGAIKENPEDFDHKRCFEKVKEFQKRNMIDQFICGVCISVCPQRLKKSTKGD